MPGPIQEKFNQERRDTIDAVRQYYIESLEDRPDSKVENEAIKFSAPIFRGEAKRLVTEAAKLGGEDRFDEAFHAISDAMKALERARDAKCGIKTDVIKTESGPSVFVRDASVCDKELVRGVEASEIQFLNLIRAGLEVADIERLPRESKILLLQNAQAFITNFANGKDDFSTNLDERIPQEKALAKEFDEEVEARVYGVLREAGVPNVENKVDVAKDFQNLKTEHYNIATISQVPVGVAKTKPVITVEVGQRSLTEEQKAEYAKISEPNEQDRPAWFNAMPWWEQELCRRNVEAITDGKHTLATQLWQLVGMKNAFEKVTLAEGEGADLVEIHAKKHAGTLASISEDEGSRQGIFSQNLGQFQEWIGEGVTPVINTLNSAGMLGRSHDPEIIKQHSKGLVGKGEYVNTAFNLARVSSGANELAGLEPLLSDISQRLKTTIERDKLAAINPLQKANFDTVIANLAPKPVSFFGRVVRAIMNPREAIIRATENVDYAIDTLQKQHAITDSEADILRNAIDLRKASDASKDAVFLRRGGNASLDAASALGFVIGQINSARNNGGLEALSGIAKRDVMTACASGKDRTGEELEIETTKAAAAHYEKQGHKVNVAKISESLVAGGHTAQQAGGVYSCGSAAGCHGTRIDNGWGMGDVTKAAVAGIVTKQYHAGRSAGSLEQVQTGLIEYGSHGTRDHHHMETVLQNPNIVTKFLAAIGLKKFLPTVTQYDKEERHPAKVAADLASKTAGNKEATISVSRDNSSASSVALEEQQPERRRSNSNIDQILQKGPKDRKTEFAQEYSRNSRGNNTPQVTRIM